MSVQLPKDFLSHPTLHIQNAASQANQSNLKGLSDEDRNKLAQIILSPQGDAPQFSGDDLERIYKTLSSPPAQRSPSDRWERITKGFQNLLGKITGHHFGRYSSEELYTIIRDNIGTSPLPLDTPSSTDQVNMRPPSKVIVTEGEDQKDAIPKTPSEKVSKFLDNLWKKTGVGSFRKIDPSSINFNKGKVEIESGSLTDSTERGPAIQDVLELAVEQLKENGISSAEIKQEFSGIKFDIKDLPQEYKE